MFWPFWLTLYVCWVSLGTGIFSNSCSATNNTQFRRSSRLFFRFLWLWYDQSVMQLWPWYRINWAFSSILSQFINKKCTLLSTISNINYKLLENTDWVLTQTLLFANSWFNLTGNTKILNATISFILLTKRFDEPLLLRK